MKQLLSMSLFTVCVWLLTACTEDDKLIAREGQEVTLELSVQTPGLQQTGGGALTRSDKTGEEATIKDNKLYIVQFDGTTASSKVIKSGTATLTSGKISFAFSMGTTGKGRVYLVANADPAATTGMTLDVFEKKMVGYTAAGTVTASTLLPMCDFKDFDPAGATTGPAFKLKSMVAKLILKCTIDADAQAEFKGTFKVNLRNVPNGSFFGEPSSFATAWRPATVTFTDKEDLGTVTNATTEAESIVFYIPENLSGQNEAVDRWIYRSVEKAPTSSTYFELEGETKDGRTARIFLFLGDPANPSDFNVHRNYAYTLTVTIMGVDETDERLSTKSYFMYTNEASAWDDINKTDDSFGN